MKRKGIFVVSAILTALSLHSCINETKETQSQKELPQSDSTLVAYEDTVNSNIISYHFKGLVPALTSETAQKIILEWMNEQMGGTYKGTTLNADSIAHYYKKQWIEEADSFFKDMPTDYRTYFTQDYTMGTLDENEKYVSMMISSYQYTGGAHGGTVYNQATFRKEDGRIFGWNMFKPDAKFNLTDLVKEGVREYLELKPDEKLEDYLLSPDSYLFPLPATDPVLTKEGVSFIYQQYEIVAYAYGMPTFTIPYSKIKHLLTETALQMIDEVQQSAKPE